MLLCSRFSAFFPFSLAFRGAVAQLGERLNGIQEVVGSIPIGSTMNEITCVPLKLSQSCDCPCSVRILSSRSP
jgi:hypothetical protein